ncbi:uncharacterized protein METZ01_LOCUS101231, partial [marine metagenome]
FPGQQHPVDGPLPRHDASNFGPLVLRLPGDRLQRRYPSGRRRV